LKKVRKVHSGGKEYGQGVTEEERKAWRFRVGEDSREAFVSAEKYFGAVEKER